MANIDARDLVKFDNLAEFVLALDPSRDMLMPWQEEIVVAFGSGSSQQAGEIPILTRCAVGLVYWSENSDFADWTPPKDTR